MNRIATSALCLLILCGCETAEGAAPPPLGATVQPLEAGRFRVIYRGGPRMSEAEVGDRALFQAAQLTLSKGFDWFQVTDRSRGLAPPTGPRFSIGIGGASFGRGGGVGVGGATSFGGEATPVVNLEIVLGHGSPPASTAAYDARDVASTLGQRFR